MLEIKKIKSQEELEEIISREDYVNFLHKYLDRFTDSVTAINNAIDYAFSDDPGKGGFCMTAYEGDEIVGALVMIRTGMIEYIPENLIVYVAVHEKCRGKGYGGCIIKKAIELCSGDVCLHVEHDNPAKRLYERLGFTSKYLEMRYSGRDK